MLDRESDRAVRKAEGSIDQVIKHDGHLPAGSAEVTARTLHVRYIVAGNPNSPKEVLAKLACDTMDNIRRRVAENPRTPLSTLMQLANDPCVEVRLSVAENPNTPLEVVERLAADDNVDVRYGVAENPYIPVEILSRLAEDDNAYVACRAQKTMQIAISAL